MRPLPKSEGITITNPDAALASGREICSELRSGVLPKRISIGLVNAGDSDIQVARMHLLAASTWLCHETVPFVLNNLMY